MLDACLGVGHGAMRLHQLPPLGFVQFGTSREGGGSGLDQSAKCQGIEPVLAFCR